MSNEPSPIDTGAVIVLYGASSSGKSTLAHRMHTLLDLPFLLLSSDQLIEAGMVPPRRDPTGPFAWVSQMRPRFFDGFHRCIPARRGRSTGSSLGPRGLGRDPDGPPMAAGRAGARPGKATTSA